MGRKKLPEEERREKPLRIRLNDDERALVDSAAESSGKKSAGWAREILLREAARAAKKSR